MKKGLFFYFILFTLSPLVSAQYYFNSTTNGEVRFEYGQGRSAINEINFVIDCDRAHCDLHQHSRALFTDFLTALGSKTVDQIIAENIDDNGGEIHNFDLEEITDRIVRNRLEDFLFSRYTDCSNTFTGASAGTRRHYVCR
jgi:hypothetical protein